jgi:hypothetical protein
VNPAGPHHRRANADDIRAVADALIERHSLDTEAFENILGGVAARAR